MLAQPGGAEHLHDRRSGNPCGPQRGGACKNILRSFVLQHGTCHWSCLVRNCKDLYAIALTTDATGARSSRQRWSWIGAAEGFAGRAHELEMQSRRASCQARR